MLIWLHLGTPSVTMNIIQIGLMATRPHWMPGIYIIYLNNYITLLGAVFPLVWVARKNCAAILDAEPAPDSLHEEDATPMDKSSHTSADDTLSCHTHDVTDGDSRSTMR